jgi:hypothetical protein
MSIADKIAARIGERADETRSVEVAEWGDDGEPAIVYYAPLTAGEIDKVARKHKGFPETWTFDSMIELIVMKARDSAGEQMFTIEHKPVLRRETAAVISKVAGSMMRAKSVDEQEGN